MILGSTLPFDVLKWWREYAERYPTMARVARDYLAIAATSTSCERLFSGGRDTFGIRGYCLNEESLQALLCLKDRYRQEEEKKRKLEQVCTLNF